MALKLEYITLDLVLFGTKIVLRADYNGDLEDISSGTHDLLFSGHTVGLNLKLGEVLDSILDKISSNTSITVTGVPDDWLEVEVEDIYVSFSNTSGEINFIALVEIDGKEVQFMFHYGTQDGRYVFGVVTDINDLGNIPIIGNGLHDVSIVNAGFIYTYFTEDNNKFRLPELTISGAEKILTLRDEAAFKKGFNFSGEIKGSKLQIGSGGSDGFIGKLLPAVKTNNNFSTDVGDNAPDEPDSPGSLHEKRFDVDYALGPITIDGFYLSYGFDAGFVFGIAIDIKGALGVVKFLVENFGLLTHISFPGTGKPKNIGPFNVKLSFKSPVGAGVSIDAGVVKGGGYLYHNDLKGEYFGALELSVEDLFTIKAIGIINTIMPDGSKGFSMIIIITAEFIPVQLGFGFMLSGVGGILGVNRTMDENAIIDGVKSNALQSILFPEDIIDNIKQIVSDIQRFFPIMEDHFVIGLMLKIQWGEFVDIQVGVIVTVPDPTIAIVGIIKVALPDEDDPILNLQVNFAGIIDTQHGFVFFRADLYNSHLLTFTLTGSFAFVVGWGDQSVFALSSGGFHPSFRDYPYIPQIPNGFKNMDRIGISLLTDDNPRLKIESYIAVTSNTVQFGASAELYAEAHGFNIYGFFGFDALFIIHPFHFTIDIGACLALRRGSNVLMGIGISIQLTGPEQWSIQGEAVFKICKVKITIPINKTWGIAPAIVVAPVIDLSAILTDEIKKTENWKATIPDNNSLHVTLRAVEPEDGHIIVHPMGTLAFSQRSIPLNNYLIQKFGNGTPKDARQFKISSVSSGTQALSTDLLSTTELFAPGNYTVLSDSDKLSRKSFDKLPSGFKLTGSSDTITPLPVVRDVTYRLSYVSRQENTITGDEENRITRDGVFSLHGLIYLSASQASAIKRSGLSAVKNGPSLNRPAEVTMPAGTFAIANVGDLKTYDGLIHGTETEAYQKYNELVTATPELRNTIQVVADFELAQ